MSKALHLLRDAVAWARANPRRAVLGGLAGIWIWLMLRPPLFPLVTNTVDLLQLRLERNALREELRRTLEVNTALRSELLSVRRREPFEIERLSRQAGLLKPEEFDYASVAEALRAAPLPSCPTASRPTQ